MILKGLGQMSTAVDLSFVTSEYALKYVEELEESINHKAVAPLEQSINILKPKMKEQDLVNIITSLLSFNPYFRMTAWEALKHPVFDSVRNPMQETFLSRMNDNCHIFH
jgi:serine/threonine protein kinase